jgi:hypothetical protein
MRTDTVAKNLSDAPANTPSADDTIKLFVEAERLKAKVDEANGKLRAHLKVMDDRGLNLKAIAMLRKLRRMDSDEATLLMRDVSRYGRWLEVPLFTQAEMFAAGDDSAAPPTDEGKAILAGEEAYAEGVAAGKAGRAANDTRFHPGTHEHTRFSDGWVAGQSMIAERMTDDPEEKKAARVAGGRRPGRRQAQRDAA